MHLFRRNRLVVGGPGQGYKPTEIFAAPNSFQSQRLIGELDLNNWPVTQTKDAFDWDGELETGFIDNLRGAVADYVEKTHVIKSDSTRKTTSADGQIIGDNTRESAARKRYGFGSQHRRDRSSAAKKSVSRIFESLGTSSGTLRGAADLHPPGK